MKTYTTPAGSIHRLYADVLNQMHVLVAGAAGSGKSVAINGILHTALYHSPAVNQFILIDPKRVELVEYKNLPHTIAYASEPQAMVNALTTAMNIVDKRYKDMQRRGIRKYDGSHIWVIIDELADLMTTNRKQVAPIIQRICQIGRASRVHILAATQCPLAIVIPTEIRVNFDCIIALRTATAQHSRNIMDATGCEKLPRYGECFYITPERRGKQHVPMVDDNERYRLINHWTPIYA